MRSRGFSLTKQGEYVISFALPETAAYTIRNNKRGI